VGRGRRKESRAAARPLAPSTGKGGDFLIGKVGGGGGRGLVIRRRGKGGSRGASHSRREGTPWDADLPSGANDGVVGSFGEGRTAGRLGKGLLSRSRDKRTGEATEAA